MSAQSTVGYIFNGNRDGTQGLGWIPSVNATFGSFRKNVTIGRIALFEAEIVDAVGVGGARIGTLYSYSRRSAVMLDANFFVGNAVFALGAVGEELIGGKSIWSTEYNSRLTMFGRTAYFHRSE